MFFLRALESTTNIIYGPFFREPAAWPHLNRSPPQGLPVSRGSSRSADRPWRSWLKHLWFPNGLLFKLHPNMGHKWHPMILRRGNGWGLEYVGSLGWWSPDFGFCVTWWRHQVPTRSPQQGHKGTAFTGFPGQGQEKKRLKRRILSNHDVDFKIF